MRLKYFMAITIFSFSSLFFIHNISYASENECEKCQEGDADCPTSEGSDVMPIEIGE